MSRPVWTCASTNCHRITSFTKHVHPSSSLQSSYGTSQSNWIIKQPHHHPSGRTHHQEWHIENKKNLQVHPRSFTWWNLKKAMTPERWLRRRRQPRGLPWCWSLFWLLLGTTSVVIRPPAARGHRNRWVGKPHRWSLLDHERTRKRPTTVARKQRIIWIKNPCGMENKQKHRSRTAQMIVARWTKIVLWANLERGFLWTNLCHGEERPTLWKKGSEY